MSLAAISTAIRQYFIDNYSETLYAFENQRFSTPESDTWVRLIILTNDAQLTNLGYQKCYRIPGIVSINVFEFTEGGTDDTERLVDIISDLFRFKNISGVKLQAPDIAKVGIVDNWNQTNISFNFTYDTV